MNLRIHPRHEEAPGVLRHEVANAHGVRHGCDACLVRHLAVCTALPDEHARKLETLAGDVKLHAGQMLAREGDARRYVFTVTSGALRRFRTLPDGRRLVAGFIMPGDFIGFSIGPKYRHSIEAITDSLLCAVSHKDMETLCGSFPGLEHELYQRACADLDATRNNLMSLARMTPLERLAGFLLDMADKRRRQGQDPAVVVLPMTRTDIADYLGLTVETVSRSFTRLRREALIATDDPHTVQLLDLKKLEALAEAVG